MSYFVTGATGFIGRNLVERLLEREGTIYVLVREGSRGRLEELLSRWGAPEGRIVPIGGDLAQPRLGVSDADLELLRGEVDHLFHLAAIYDLTADAERQRVANVEGTRHACELAAEIGAGSFQMVSSIAAAGLYRGIFREDMFEEAENLDTNPYFRTKHEAERVVRTECAVPWRVYRPSVVVGHSKTGEIDKIDGPYYFFKLIQQAGRVLPSWLPLVGIEGGEINIVPVDFVAAAIDHIAHQPGLDGRAFHLVDPRPKSVGRLINVLAHAAGAPEFALRLDARAVSPLPEAIRTLVPRSVRSLLPVAAKASLALTPPARRLAETVLGDIGIPREVLTYIDYPTHFDCSEAQDALDGSGIVVPPLESYADRLWEYWERHLDPELVRDRALSTVVAGKIVMITGASSGIGRASALRIADAGGVVLLVSRTREKLEEVKAEIEKLGGTAHVHPCDLADLDDIARMADEVLEEHGHVDILVNNAGRSIRRSVALSYDRMHDFERTIQLNYFGAVQLILKLLPRMRERKSGQIINISSIGVQTNPPRFSAYVASKAALDAFSRTIASEIVDDGVAITTIHMPLVRTPMIAPTKIYNAFPTKSPEEAADMVAEAIVKRPKRIATALGNAGQLLYAVSPKTVDWILNQGYKLFPDSSAAKGHEEAPDEAISSEAVAFAHFMKGVHW